MKKISLTISIIIFFSLVAPVANAFECIDVDKDQQSLFIIIEEPISYDTDEFTINCFRICDLAISKGKRICKLDKTCSATPEQTCQRVQVLKSKTGTNLVYNYVGMIYKWAAGTIGIVAVGAIVFNGIYLITSGGDSARMETAKGRIFQSILGLVVLFLSGLLLYTINPTFFV